MDFQNSAQYTKLRKQILRYPPISVADKNKNCRSQERRFFMSVSGFFVAGECGIGGFQEEGNGVAVSNQYHTSHQVGAVKLHL